MSPLYVIIVKIIPRINLNTLNVKLYCQYLKWILGMFLEQIELYDIYSIYPKYLANKFMIFLDSDFCNALCI